MRENRGMGRRHRNNRGRRGRVWKAGGRKLHSPTQRMEWLKSELRTERSDSEMDTEGGGEACISQLQSRHKKS